MFKVCYTKIMSSTLLALYLSACVPAVEDGTIPSGTPMPPSAESSPPPAPAPLTDPAQSVGFLESEVETIRFLTRSSWGGSQSDIDALMNSEAEDWIEAEMSKTPTFTLPAVLELPRDENGDANSGYQASALYWDHIVNSDDELRQRMAFALSQVFVFSDNADKRRQVRRAYYQDILIRNAFGNYRDLIEEITYSPAMATWLTYWQNRKGDPRTGRMPDENYAREILQLFSIGVVELNMDGTARLDDRGHQIETYTNDDVVGLAKVFTGMTGKGETFWRADEDADYHPLVIWNSHHSLLEKTFLGTTIPPGTSGEESIDIALDTIFEHPNVAPFIARQLIQRFTKSNPSPDYVERVATAFEEGTFIAPNGTVFGSTGRGDLAATLAAVLLDECLFDEEFSTLEFSTTGKIREPVLRFMHWVKAFDVQNIDAENEHRLRTTFDPVTGLGQQPFRSPSVFNFYRPGYIAPGTRSGEMGLTTPELQIVNDSSAIGYFNFMTDFAFDSGAQLDIENRTYVADYSDELQLVDDIPALVDHLDILLTSGRMPEDERASIVNVLNTLPVNTSTLEREDTDRLQIVQTAVALVLNSPSFAVAW